MPKRPNCFVQQLMPTSGLTTRGDLMNENSLRFLRQNEDSFCDARHEAPAKMSLVGPRLEGPRVDEGEQALIEAAAGFYVVQRHSRLLALCIKHRPLPESERIIGGHQGKGAVTGGGGAHQADLNLPRQVLHSGHGYVTAKTHVICQQDAEGR